MRTSPSALAGLALLVAGLLATTPADAQTWNYKSYKKTSTGSWDTNDFVPGTITVTQDGGRWMYQVFAGRMDACWRTALPATVTRTDETTLIEVAHPMAGCESIRYTIRNDGSGGFRETKYGERWVRNKFDFDLTPVK
jgi:hypothetical protein